MSETQTEQTTQQTQEDTTAKTQTERVVKPEGITPDIETYIRKQLQESERIMREQLHSKVNGLQKTVEQLEAEKKEKENAEKKAEEEKALAEEKLRQSELTALEKQEEQNKLMKQEIETVVKYSKDKIAELETRLNTERLLKKRAELIAEAKGEIISEMVADPARNPAMTEEDLTASITMAKTAYANYTKPLVEPASKKQVSQGSRSPAGAGNLGSQTRNYTFDEVSHLSGDDLRKAKDSVLAKYDFDKF